MKPSAIQLLPSNKLDGRCESLLGTEQHAMAPNFKDAKLRLSISRALLRWKSPCVVALLGVVVVYEIPEVSSRLPPAPPPHLLPHQEEVLLLLPLDVQLGLPLAAREHCQAVAEPEIRCPGELQAGQLGQVLGDAVEGGGGDSLSCSFGKI